MGSPDTSSPAPKRPGGIRRVLGPTRRWLMAAAVLAAVGSGLTLLPLAGIAHIAGIVLADVGTQLPVGISARTDIIWTVALSVASLFAGTVLVFAGELLAHLADNRITHRLRLDATHRLSRVPLGWFSSRSSGEIKQALQDDVATLHSLTAHFYTGVGRALGAIITSAIYLFVMDWRMGIVALLAFPGFFLFLRHAMNAAGANMPVLATGLQRINGSTVEFINGMPVIKAFGTAGRAHAGYRDAVDTFADAFVEFTRPLVGVMAHAHAMIAPVTVLGLVLAFGALFVHLGWIAPLDILPFALVAPGICAPLLLLHTLLHDLGSATGAAHRVLALLETPVLPQPAPGAARVPAGNRIRFHDVSHAYADGHQALSHVSFTLEPGTVTAVVGPSGAGKSTLARLLVRFFDPQSGHISIGETDLRQMTPSDLYQRIGFVLQEVRLIRASVRDNIALGRASASQAEIESAALAANLHHRILALPRGYESVIGEDAILSGGEQQRLSIARAVLLDPPVLVLDEATASVDAGNEAAIQDALSRFAQGRTVLVIAHRLDTVMQADQILVMEDGAITERGTHARLLAAKGCYARLWSLGAYPVTPHAATASC